MKISIGILAYNESASISKTLKSLFQQSVFNDSDSQNNIEIVVVANGCTDNTADISRTTLEELIQQSSHPNLQYSVCEVAEPGKSHAWNLYVHQFSELVAKYLFLMDADIQFLEIHTLCNMIDILEDTPEAYVAVDAPIKDIVLKEKKSLIEKLSSAVSSSSVLNTRDVWICGQLYCGRASVLRQIWMPPGLPSEDGFLTTMIRTDRFTSLPILERIVRTPVASHIFEAYTNPQSLLRHEKRIIIGMTINHFLCDYLKTNCDDQKDAGSFIKQMNDQDPLWLNKLFQNILSQKRLWVIPNSWLFRRFQGLKYHRLPKAILLLPVAVIAFLVNFIVFFQANRDLHRGANVGYW